MPDNINMRKLALYLWYFITSETKELRLEAQKAALAWCKTRHTHNYSEQYRIDFQAFTRAFINTRCHELAKQKLSIISKD